MRQARAAGQTIGIVPTMGSLHEGHLSLVRRARRETDRVVVSIFVNPLQFAPGEDFGSYPRSIRRDAKLLREAETDVLFLPTEERLYPSGFSTRIEVDELDEVLCGRSRPGHFRGVCTIVMKLLQASLPDRLYLGQKDYQQATILRRMVRDLDVPVRTVVCPIVRERDGLAMSSRNVYLSEEERNWAPALQAALADAKRRILAGDWSSPGAVTRSVKSRLRSGPGNTEYVELLHADTLQPVRVLEGELVLALAHRLGGARLIDNVLIRVPRERKGNSERKVKR